MSERNDGGPAFPQPQAPYDMSTFCGVSVRDYFAAKAVLGLLAEPFHPGTKSSAQAITGRSVGSEQAAELYAQAAYVIADAMLAERSK